MFQMPLAADGVMFGLLATDDAGDGVQAGIYSNPDSGGANSVSAGVPAATIAARESGRHDPQFVVIDEVAGQWIALIGSPADFRHGIIALILFRLFDITKPFPARQLEKLPEGWGIVFDDVAAGLYALVVASLLRLWIH